ncbi:uncharacterized protein LOC132729219 [Ruditapes philippinarum]|uniref:uncharacterized protein LOC132729219 n=1 Tax=Ruditapes philippinarum TaxID=129788 RepID=UPI00295A6F03|nr:uncharacterized protein LOC132729219 [Ruditapes philippinarum]
MTKLLSITKPKSSAQIVAKQHMKKHLKRIRNKEYSRLRDMVPAIAKKQNISKVTVIEEAVRYIDELHRALASRLTNTEISSSQGNADILKDLVHSFIPTDFYERRAPPSVDFEKQQKVPSYLSRSKRPARFV